MAKESMFETAQPVEKAILIGIDRSGGVRSPANATANGSASGITPANPGWSLSESLAELERLVITAGAEVVGSLSQRLASPNPRTYIGKGKVAEMVEAVRDYHADLVVFDEELSPTQQSNLEKELEKVSWDVKLIDRTALILDIFALHATTREGRLQVRLAQNQYLLPRLRGMWAHLVAGRMGGGVGSRFGEGESQLEVDRRMIRRRIESIRGELKKLQADRATQRSARLGSGIFRIALAGYTNAGKSTLLNYLTQADVLVYDQLFATLDSTTRRLLLPDGGEATLTDTVGFIQKLPTTLVEAFRSTLDEITNADLILHIVDASSSQRDEQIEATAEVLQQIGAQEIPQTVVYNKCDLLPPEEAQALQRSKPNAQLISAATGEGIAGLLAHIQAAAYASSRFMEVLIPFDKGNLVNLAYQRTTIVSERYTENGTWMQLRVPPVITAQFEPYVDKSGAGASAYSADTPDIIDA